MEIETIPIRKDLSGVASQAYYESFTWYAEFVREINKIIENPKKTSLKKNMLENNKGYLNSRSICSGRRIIQKKLAKELIGELEKIIQQSDDKFWPELLKVINCRVLAPWEKN